MRVPCRTRRSATTDADEASASCAQSHEQRRQIHEGGPIILSAARERKASGGLDRNPGCRYWNRLVERGNIANCSQISVKLPSRLRGNMAAPALVLQSVRSSVRSWAAASQSRASSATALSSGFAFPRTGAVRPNRSRASARGRRSSPWRAEFCDVGFDVLAESQVRSE